MSRYQLLNNLPRLSILLKRVLDVSIVVVEKTTKACLPVSFAPLESPM
jgi:hypothetical protein